MLLSCTYAPVVPWEPVPPANADAAPLTPFQRLAREAFAPLSPADRAFLQRMERDHG